MHVKPKYFRDLDDTDSREERMFRRVEGLDSHVIGLRVSDDEGGSTLRETLDDFAVSLRKKERVSYYIELDDSIDVPFPRLLRDISHSLRHIQQFTNLHRVVVVSDKNWVQTLAKWQDKVFRFVEIRTFPTAQRGLASEWVNSAPPKPTSSLTILRLPPVACSADVPVVGLRLNGKLRKEDIGVFEKAIGQHRDMRLLFDFQKFGGFSSKIFTVATAELKLEAMSKISRYAVVNPPPVAAAIIKRLDALVPTVEIRTFDDIDTAWVWTSM